MNRKQLILLLVVLAVIGGAGLLLVKHNDETWQASGNDLAGKTLGNFQVNDVAAIHIKGATDLTLARKDDTWRVQERGDYPANFTAISELLLQLTNLKLMQPEEIGPSQLARLDLEDPGKGSGSGTLVEIKDAGGKVLESFILGKKHSSKAEAESPSPFHMGDAGDGRYVMLKSDPQHVELVSDTLDRLDPKAGEWISKDFIKVEKLKSISFVSTNAANSWKLTRDSESSPWVLADSKPGEKPDSGKLSSVASTLNFPSFVDVATNTAPAENGMDHPLLVTLETFDGFTYHLKVGKKTPENNYYLSVAVSGAIPKERTPGKDEKPDDKKKLDKEFADKTKTLEDKLKQESSLDKWTYVVSSWVIEPLIRDRSQILEEKKDEKAESKPAAAAAKPNKPPTVVSKPVAVPAPAKVTDKK